MDDNSSNKDGEKEKSANLVQAHTHLLSNQFAVLCARVTDA